MKHLYYDYKSTENALKALGTLNDSNLSEHVDITLSFIHAKALDETVKNETVPSLLTARHVGYVDGKVAEAYDAIVTVFADCEKAIADKDIDVEPMQYCIDEHLNTGDVELACDDYTLLIDIERFASKYGKGVMKECKTALREMSLENDSYSKAVRAKALPFIKRYLGAVGLVSVVDSLDNTDARDVLRAGNFVDKCGQADCKLSEKSKSMQYIACRILQARERINKLEQEAEQEAKSEVA